jgi:hypothetical protein
MLHFLLAMLCVVFSKRLLTKWGDVPMFSGGIVVGAADLLIRSQGRNCCVILHLLPIQSYRIHAFVTSRTIKFLLV